MVSQFTLRVCEVKQKFVKLEQLLIYKAALTAVKKAFIDRNWHERKVFWLTINIKTMGLGLEQLQIIL